MTAFSDFCHNPLSALLFSSAIALGFIQIYLLVFSVWRKAGRRFTLLSCARIILGTAFLSVMLDGNYKIDYLSYKREYFDIVRGFYDLPVILIIVIESLSALISTVSIVYLIKKYSARPSDYSVKNGFDHLPIGICISSESGLVLLSNLKMNEIIAGLNVKTATDAFALWDEVRKRGSEQNGQRLVQTDDSAFVFERNSLEIGGKTYFQYIAEDQSEQYRAVRELEKENAQLRDYQYRLKAYQVQEKYLIIRQENLKARTMIHTQLGGAMLTGKYYLEHPEKIDEGELLKMLWYINTYLLAEADSAESERDEYDAAVKMANGIGVELQIEGAVPADDPFRSVLGQAIAECAANTVKHACGDTLRVVISENDGSLSFNITNNGDPPKNEITESGGLLSLRCAAEDAGAVMDLQSLPVFSLNVIFDKNK